MKIKAVVILVLTFIAFCIILLNVISCNNTAKYIKISTSEQLAKIGVDDQFPIDGKYILTNDLILDSTYQPVGPNEAVPFSGTFDGGGNKISVTWDSEAYSVFRYVEGAEFRSLNMYVAGSEIRAPLVYFARDSTFRNISVDGSITKKSYQIGGLVWASSGCTFTNVRSSVDMILSSIVFDRYNILGGIVCQITAESENLDWKNKVYANKFINCSYDGNISIDLNKASYTGISSTALWTGSLYGATAYDSPIIYFGVYIKNCSPNAVYNITGELDKDAVKQYNFIDSAGNVNVTYDPNNKGASTKTEPEIVNFGRTHQNVQLTYSDMFIVKESYGYYGASGTETDAGDNLWSHKELSVSGIAIIASAIFAAILAVLFGHRKKRC